MRIARDGLEWERLVPVLREGRAINPDFVRVEIALDDRAHYGDFLRAADAADRAGNMFVLDVVDAALPVYPRHGRGGGLELGIH